MIQKETFKESLSFNQQHFSRLAERTGLKSVQVHATGYRSSKAVCAIPGNLKCTGLMEAVYQSSHQPTASIVDAIEKAIHHPIPIRAKASGEGGPSSTGLGLAGDHA